MKKGRRDFHFRPVEDVFETKIKTFLRRLCDVFVSVGYPSCKRYKQGVPRKKKYHCFFRGANKIFKKRKIFSALWVNIGKSK